MLTTDAAQDVLFEKMTFDDFDAVVRSKVRGALNFHHALAGHALDCFVLLSSVAGIVGNRGQAAYAAANTFLDALALHRRRCGLAGAALDLAAVDGVGYLAENAERQAQVLKSLGGSTVGEAEVLALVEAAVAGTTGDACGGQCITGLDLSDATALPFYAADERFAVPRNAALQAEAAAGGEGGGAADMAVSQRLRRASSADEARDLVALGLRDKLGAILMLPTEVVAAQQATTSVTAFGLDSLTAIELRNWIGKEFQAHLQVLELLTSGLLRDLAGLVLKKSRLQGVWSQ